MCSRILSPVLALVCAPLLLGIINRTKAWMSGRQGAPLVQPYFNLVRLARRGVVYSRTTTFVFRAGPLVALSATLAALFMVPCGAAPAALNFGGDFLLLAYLLGLGRFATVLAGLDTGSSFEGLGASREVFFSALAEPALLLALAAVAARTGELSLSGMCAALTTTPGFRLLPCTVFAVAALFVVLLAENARLPVDDPATHLELTMIHEVMVLDHSGVDLGLIEYGAALKLWIFAAIIVSLLVPASTWSWLVNVPCIMLLAVIVGLLESSMARLRVNRVPQLLVAAGVFAVLALLLH